MPHYGLLGDFRFEDPIATEDLRGSKIYGRNDEKLGTLEDVIFDHATGRIEYVVVDAGGWFTHKKFLIPPHRLHTSAEHPEDFTVNLDKDTIEALPRYHEPDLKSDEKWKRYEKQYDDAWHAGPIQHRKGSDRDITPTADEMPAEPGSIGSQLSPQEQERLSSRIVPPLANEVPIEHTPVGLGDRWSTFEERLRHHRRQITKNCTTCTVEPISDRPSENAA
jgi:sporulation protein YlmC with PRC-barrel domain